MILKLDFTTSQGQALLQGKLCAFEFLKSADTSKLQSGHMLQRNDTYIQQGRSKREIEMVKRTCIKYEIELNADNKSCVFKLV